jgi:predicted RNA binding protein YcfA (HicA-like mRNA interferase family)
LSPRIPSVRPRDLTRALERAGWVNVRQRGSHVRLRKDGNPNIISVAQHTKDMKRGTVAGILHDAGITVDEFIELLRG